MTDTVHVCFCVWHKVKMKFRMSIIFLLYPSSLKYSSQVSDPGFHRQREKRLKWKRSDQCLFGSSHSS